VKIPEIAGKLRSVRTNAGATAIGFSVHTGWAASVLVAGPLRTPRIVDRRRIRLADSEVTVGAEVYHRAARMRGAAAGKFVREAQKAAARRARGAVEILVESQPLVAAGFLVSAGKLPSDLAVILRSHPLIHTAEGVFYREALATAAEDCGLEVVRIPRRELQERFASALGTDEADAREQLAALGRDIGPPWARDQKDAAMAALVALVDAAAGSSRKS
jgi:hypothetical protein